MSAAAWKTTSGWPRSKTSRMVSIADVAQDDLVGVEQAVAGQAHLGRLEAGLVAVEQVQLLRPKRAIWRHSSEPMEPPAGDQDLLAGDLVGDHRHVELDRAPAEEVGDVDIAQVSRGRPAADDLPDLGEHEHVEARRRRRAR